MKRLLLSAFIAGIVCGAAVGAFSGSNASTAETPTIAVPTVTLFGGCEPGTPDWSLQIAVGKAGGSSCSVVTDGVAFLLAGDTDTAVFLIVRPDQRWVQVIVTTKDSRAGIGTIDWSSGRVEIGAALPTAEDGGG